MTAAATTAVFATGDGPGVTALATTAVFATGAPTTLIAMDHTYDSIGDKPVNIVAISDAAGRTLGGASQANAHLTKAPYGGWGAFPGDPTRLP